MMTDYYPAVAFGGRAAVIALASDGRLDLVDPAQVSPPPTASAVL